MKIGLEKLNTYKSVVNMLLDSRAIGLFIDPKFAREQRFKLDWLEQAINVDRTINVEGAITHEVEVNLYSKGYMERTKIYIYDYRKANVRLGLLQLVTHNLEINWETGEVKMMRYLATCKQNRDEKRGN